MKTFREFIIEARDAVKDATYTGDAAEQERIRKRELDRGFDPDKERAEARRKAKEELLRNRSKNTTVPGGNQADSPFSGKPQPQPSQPSGGTPPAGGGGGLAKPPSGVKPPSGGGPLAKAASREVSAGAKSATNAVAKEAEKAAAKTATKTVGKGILKGLGRVMGPASAALEVADERSKGSGWLRSLAKGATVAVGGALGGTAGTVGGPVGTVAGSIGGSMAASKAFDTVAGANAVGRKAIATDNRKSQSGGGLVGTGGKTTFDTKKNTITSGGKTAQLGKTSVVNDPKTGKQGVGYLAYKGGKAVYKRPDTKSLAQTSSNPLERIGRSLFAGAYKKSDAANAANKLATARASDATRNQKLGVKLKPGG